MVGLGAGQGSRALPTGPDILSYWEIGVFTLAEEANCVFTLLFVTL